MRQSRKLRPDFGAGVSPDVAGNIGLRMQLLLTGRHISWRAALDVLGLRAFEREVFHLEALLLDFGFAFLHRLLLFSAFRLFRILLPCFLVQERISAHVFAYRQILKQDDLV